MSQRQRKEEAFFCGRCGSKLSRDAYVGGCPCLKNTTESMSGVARGLRLATHEMRRVALPDPALEVRRRNLQLQLERLEAELTDLRGEAGDLRNEMSR